MKKGFTLIELLVVISIIGVLSAVTLAAVTKARDSAYIAAGQQFASRTYSTIGLNLIGWWNFDDDGCAGTTAKDSSGNSFTATLNGATWSTDSPFGKGCSVSFDGVNDMVTLGNTFSTYFKTDRGPSTISLWFKPLQYPGGSDMAQIFSDNWYEWGMHLSSQNVYGQVYNTLDGGPVQLNKWYQIVLTHNPDTNVARLYVNGAFKKQINNTFSTNGYTDDPFTLGADNNGGTPNKFYKGLIDDVRLYTTSLPE